MDRLPVAIVSVTTPPTLSAVTPFLLNDSRDTECYSKSMAVILMLICAVCSERPPETSTQKFPDPQ